MSDEWDFGLVALVWLFGLLIIALVVLAKKIVENPEPFYEFLRLAGLALAALIVPFVVGFGVIVALERLAEWVEWFK